MKIQGAVIKKDGIKFAAVKVEKHVFDVPGRARDTMTLIQPVFPNLCVVFVTFDSAGTPAFYGRPDIVRIMTSTEVGTIEWKEYALDEARDSAN
jgi:hypothetical protein